MLAPTLPLPGKMRQSRGFDLIRIQLPHPPGNIRIPIPPSYTGYLMGHVYAPLRATCIFHAGAHSRTLVTILIIIIILYIIINFIMKSTKVQTLGRIWRKYCNIWIENTFHAYVLGIYRTSFQHNLHCFINACVHVVND